MRYCYEYPRPALTVDCFIYYRENNSLRILLIKRKNPPFEQTWALPGGFVDPGELLLDAALRELQEETGLSGIHLEFAGIFDKPDRDPRGRTISIVFSGNAGNRMPATNAGSDAAETKWFGPGEFPGLAFDHLEIIEFICSKLGIKEA